MRGNAVASGPVVKDPTIFHWAFFVRWSGRESEQDAESRRKEIEAALCRAAEWAGEPAPNAWPWPSERTRSVRLIGTGWQESGCELRSLEARTLLDTVYIQTGLCLPGDQPADVFASLGDRMCSFDGGSSLLGEAYCLWWEVNDGLDEPNAKGLAEAVCKAWSADVAAVTHSLVSMPWGYWVGPCGVEGEGWVFIVKTGAVEQASDLLYRLMPQVLLARLKCRRINTESEKQLLPEARKVEASLNEELNRFPKQHRRLEALEEAVENVAKFQGEFAELLSQVEENLETMRVNVGNLERTLNDPVLAPSKTRLDELLIAPWRLASEQLATDLRYLSVTRDQADRMMQSLQTRADVCSSRWERRTNILVGIFQLSALSSHWLGSSRNYRRWLCIGEWHRCLPFSYP